MLTWLTVLFVYHYGSTSSFKRGLEQGYAHSRQIISEVALSGGNGNSHIHVIGARYDCGVPGCTYRDPI